MLPNRVLVGRKNAPVTVLSLIRPLPPVKLPFLTLDLGPRLSDFVAHSAVSRLESPCLFLEEIRAVRGWCFNLEGNRMLLARPIVRTQSTPVPVRPGTSGFFYWRMLAVVPSLFGASFTPGNLVVYRMGDGRRLSPRTAPRSSLMNTRPPARCPVDSRTDYDRRCAAPARVQWDCNDRRFPDALRGGQYVVLAATTRRWPLRRSRRALGDRSPRHRAASLRREDTLRPARRRCSAA